MNQFDGSALIRFVTVALGSNYPMRLTFGLALGALLKMGVHAVAHSYPETAWAALNEFNMFWFMFAVAPILFVPIIFSQKTAQRASLTRSASSGPYLTKNALLRHNGP